MITSLLGNSGLNFRGLRRRRLGDNLSSNRQVTTPLPPRFRPPPPPPGLPPPRPPKLPPIPFIDDIIRGELPDGDGGTDGGRILPPIIPQIRPPPILPPLPPPPQFRPPPLPFLPPPPQRRPI